MKYNKLNINAEYSRNAGSGIRLPYAVPDQAKCPEIEPGLFLFVQIQ